ncbi:hypothetical protein NQ317_011461 [Molorchus minor]|uniref:ZP domain-containing protein n=1 Tax=Molorchus minor TaxID=1323400 RepID=A0ABQ9JL44_9CUCU|nr:hypothetical protein NQ317_011461 [Molorchus minor]
MIDEIVVFTSKILHVVRPTSDLWPLDRPEGMPSIQSLEVMCGKDHMDVHLTFSQPFEGIVSSKGQHGDPRIAYARCGTKPDLNGQFYENTVVVQYDKDLLEVWDEAKRLRCEWFNDYEKTASKPPMVIADLDVIQLDFRASEEPHGSCTRKGWLLLLFAMAPWERLKFILVTHLLYSPEKTQKTRDITNSRAGEGNGAQLILYAYRKRDNVDCWMEIQHGKGPWAPPVSGIVPLGSTLTLVVAINDYRGEFDMRVKSCVASDGGGHVIQLSDEFGCVLRPKMISRFPESTRGGREGFPDALSVHIKCKVEICRHGCLDHCQLQPSKEGDVDPELEHYVNPLERKDGKGPSEENMMMPDPVEQDLPEDALYEDVVHENEDDLPPASNMPHNAKLSTKRQPQFKKPDEAALPTDETELDITALPHKDIYPMPLQDKFPHGPRTFTDTLVAAPRSLNIDILETSTETTPTSATPKTENSSASRQASQHVATRRRRSVVVSDRKARSADVGVSGLYEVISEADLAFSPDSRAEAVTVFQGRIREESPLRVGGCFCGGISSGGWVAAVQVSVAERALGGADAAYWRSTYECVFELDRVEIIENEDYANGEHEYNAGTEWKSGREFDHEWKSIGIWV